MRYYIRTIFPLSIVALLLLAVPVSAQGTAPSGAFFIENRGQWPAEVRLMASNAGLDAWVTDRGIVYDFHRTVEIPATVRNAGAPLDVSAMRAPESSRAGHIVRMSFTGSGGRAHGVEARRLAGHYNYLRGNDTSLWARNVPLYAEASIDHLYDGIDARLLLEGGGLRYDLMVAAGADPSDVRMELEGALSVDLDKARGELVIATSMGEVRQGGLFAYQDIDGARRRVECAFRKRGDGSIGFALGSYDRTRPLVIDPLVWSTYLPNANFALYGGELRLDRDGNPIVLGNTMYAGFPTTPGAYDRTRNGTLGTDVVVTKVTADASALIFSTFIGGEIRDNGGALAIDPNGDIYIGGWTLSDDYPTTPGAFKRQIDSIGEGIGYGDIDSSYRFVSAFATKLSADGSSLLYSTFIGPGFVGTDGFGSAYVNSPAAALNANGELYLTGYTMGLFPVTPGAFQTTPDAYRTLDAFVCRLNSDGSDLLLCTYIGGRMLEQGAGIALDRTGNILVLGTTISSDFQTTPGAFDRLVGNGEDIPNNDLFLVKLDPEGRNMIFGTVIGGSNAENVEGFAVDALGDIYLSGTTYSTDFPVTPNAYKQTFDSARTPETQTFGVAPYLLKLDHTGSFLHYSTFVDVPTRSLNVLPSGEVWMAGGTNKPTPDAWSRTRKGEGDGTISLMNASGNRFLYATFFGGSGHDWVESIVIRGDTIIGLATTMSIDFPVTPGVVYPDAIWPVVPESSNNEHGLFKLLPDRPGCSFPASAGADISVCSGKPVTLRGTASGGTAPYRFIWRDETGVPIGTGQDLTVTPSATTRYILVVHDEAGCVSEPDTVTAQVLPTPTGQLGGVESACLNEAATVTISSINGTAGTRFQLLVDGTAVTPVLEPATAPLPRAYTRTFDTPGTYRYQLVIWDPVTGCSDTVTRMVIVHPLPTPAISISGEIRICEGDSLVVSAAEGYDNYLWSNGATTREIVIREAGLYHVDATAPRTGCRGRSAALLVTVDKRPDVPVVTRRGDTLFSTPADTYQWYRNGGLLAGETRQWIIPGRKGSYTVAVGNLQGCSALSPETFAGPIRTVRLDTVRGRVGEPLVLTMRVDPPSAAVDELRGFTARLRVDPKALFIHQGRSPDYPAASDPLVTREQSGAVIVIVRATASPALADSILFQIDLEGLVTGQPLNAVVIESVIDDQGDIFEIAGDGLVILDGCAISRAFGRRARLVETRPNPAGAGDLTVRWNAPRGAEAQLRLVDALGSEVWRRTLPAGTEQEQEISIPLSVPSGLYMLQLIEGAETMALPVVVE